jgi:hypothetical protein
VVQGWPQAKCKTLSEKQLKVNRAGAMAQVIEELSSNHEIMSLNQGLQRERERRDPDTCGEDAM